MRPIPERWRILLLVGLIAFVATSTFGQRAAMNRDIALVTVTSAITALDAGDVDRAEDLLHRAQETDATFSDPRYLLAMIASQSQARTIEAVDMLRTALVLDSWSRFSSDDASVLLAEL